MTYGLGRAEILSAQANGLTLLVLALLIVYGAIVRLVSPPEVHGGVVLVVALAGIPINLLGGTDPVAAVTTTTAASTSRAPTGTS